MSEILLNLFRTAINLIPQLIILAASIYYFARKRHIAGVFMIIGNCIGIATLIFHFVVVPYLLKRNMIEPLWQQEGLWQLVGSISTLGYYVFAIGFFLVIHNTVKESKVAIIDTEP